MKRFIFLSIVTIVMLFIFKNGAFSTVTVSKVMNKAAEIPKVTWNKLWGMYEEYLVFTEDDKVVDFTSFTDGVAYAKEHKNSEVYLKKDHQLVWSGEKRKNYSVLNIPIVPQNPELPRGCEVTSLTMMLRHAGMDVDKMTLAKKVRKDHTIPVKENGKYIFFGNPNEGFVGNMYSFDRPGFGVYHEPVKDLAEKYLPGKIIDMTGADFEDVLYQIHKGYPVWVIVNVEFKKLGPEFFTTWDSPDGEVTTTFKEHSVLVTGYSKNFVYVNDPIDSVQNKKINIASFKEAWEQMGRQAITYR
ncbi:MAG TPA: hypothetical protein DDY49_15285 [Paenibacillaceae bacterium]|nr:hypothetical protein [Paenibacillaceae bacterium]